MKKRLLVPFPFAVLLLCGCVSTAAPDAAPYDSYTGFALAPEAVLPNHETHPSLWFNADDLLALRARRTADAFARERWAAVERLADLSAELPPPPAASAETKAIHQYYGSLSMAARAHAVVALLSDDPSVQSAHRQRAEALLLRAYDGPIFDLDSQVRGSPVDEIYRGSWLQNYAHAYDCIQPTLTTEIDREIRERLAREAQCVYENLYRWTPRSPHNHLSKPAWGLGSMALTLSDDPRAAAWLARAIEAANKNTRYFFSGDGLYREGSHYLIFSLTNFVPFLYHYRNVSGVDGFTTYQPVFEAMVKVRNSRGWLPNIEDSYIRPTPTHLVAGAYGNVSTELSSSAPLAQVLMWSYVNADLTPFDRERAESGFNYSGASWDYPLELDEFLTHDPTMKPVAPDADPNVFLAGGQTVFRDSWTSHGAEQRYLLFHGMPTADNHNHDDHLSFVIEAAGQMMCSDTGYSRGTYAGAERTAWYNTATAHNTLTFNGEAAGDPAPNVTPPTLFRFDTPSLVGEEKQAVFGTAATWQRAILWVDRDYYVVSDRLQAAHPGTIVAALHGGRGQLDHQGGHQVWSYEADNYGPAAQSAPNATTTTESGELTYIKGDYAAFPYLKTTAQSAHAAWLTVLAPAVAETPPAHAVENVSNTTCTALAISSADRRCLVASQPAAGPMIKIAGIETDGALVLIRRDTSGRPLSYAVHAATSLVIDGRAIFRAAQPRSETKDL